MPSGLRAAGSRHSGSDSGAVRPIRRLGQNFLVCRNIAELEASFAVGRRVIEIGPGRGMLTEQLCMAAEAVVAVELDRRLFEELGQLGLKNLKLVNSDFFSISEKEFRDYDLMVANVPYNLSSKSLMWLASFGKEAVLCLQKEFVEHMSALPGTRKYSKLGVFSSLFFNAETVCDVPRGCFYPVPRVSSRVIHLRPTGLRVPECIMCVISMLMEHKKKKLRNALIDSRARLGITKERAAEISEHTGAADVRPFQIPPQKLLDIARAISENADVRQLQKCE